MKPERRPRSHCCIQQIVFADARWSVQQMAVDVWKLGTEKSKPFVHASRIFFRCVIGRFPASAQKQTSGCTSSAHRWQSGVMASSTCLIFGTIPNACWLSPRPVSRRFLALASA
jgi:hypothetical protein